MKKIGQHVVKGKFDPDDGVIRITLFDGKFTTGYRVVKFEHSLSNPLVNEEYKVVVGTSPNITNTFSWDKNIEIAWGYGGNNNNVAATFSNFSFVDPENLIIEDLYLVGNNIGTGQICYMITLEKYDLTDWEGAAAMAINKE